MQADPFNDPIHETLELARRLTDTVADLLIPLLEDPLAEEEDDADLGAAIDFSRAAGEVIGNVLRDMGEPVPAPLGFNDLVRRYGKPSHDHPLAVSTAVAVRIVEDEVVTHRVEIDRPMYGPTSECPEEVEDLSVIDGFEVHGPPPWLDPGERG